MASELKKSVVSRSLSRSIQPNSQISLTHQFIIVSLKPLNDYNASYYKPSFLSPRRSLRKVLQNSVGFVVSTLKTLFNKFVTVFLTSLQCFQFPKVPFSITGGHRKTLCVPTYLGDNPPCFASRLCIIMGINNGIERGREPEAAVRAKSGLACIMIPQARVLDLRG